jgi:hypothetical protein
MLVRRLVKYGVGLAFVACLSAIVVYAVHGWEWDSRFAGGRLTLSLPEFVAFVVLVTLVLGVCIDYWRTKQVGAAGEKELLTFRNDMVLRIAIISTICIAILLLRVVLLLPSEWLPITAMWLIVIAINYVYDRHRYHRTTFP